MENIYYWERKSVEESKVNISKKFHNAKMSLKLIERVVKPLAKVQESISSWQRKHLNILCLSSVKYSTSWGTLRAEAIVWVEVEINGIIENNCIVYFIS